MHLRHVARAASRTLTQRCPGGQRAGVCREKRQKARPALITWMMLWASSSRASSRASFRSEPSRPMRRMYNGAAVFPQRRRPEKPPPCLATTTGGNLHFDAAGQPRPPLNPKRRPAGSRLHRRRAHLMGHRRRSLVEPHRRARVGHRLLPCLRVEQARQGQRQEESKPREHDRSRVRHHRRAHLGDSPGVALAALRPAATLRESGRHSPCRSWKARGVTSSPVPGGTSAQRSPVSTRRFQNQSTTLAQSRALASSASGQGLGGVSSGVARTVC
jgi:hypothetical protein